MKFNKILSFFMLLGIALFVTACSSGPQPSTQPEVVQDQDNSAAANEADKAASQDNSEPTGTETTVNENVSEEEQLFNDVLVADTEEEVDIGELI